MYAQRRGGSRRAINIWPGFVDGLSNLLLVVIFVLMVFMVAQFFLSVALTGKDKALTKLESEINELADLLALERSANSELRVNVEQLSAELQSSLASRETLSSQLAALSEERESLANQLASLTDERDRLATQVKEERAERERLSGLLDTNRQSLDEARTNLQQNQQALAEKESELKETRSKLDAALARIQVEQKKLDEALAAIAAGKAELEDAYKTVDADKQKIEAQLAELAILKSLRDDLVKKLQESQGNLEESQNALAEQNKALDEQKELSEEAQLQVTLLNRQLAALREQLAKVSDALELTESKNKEQEVQIADLGKRLNVALASKVQELARYRSEFFGRLREILGNRQDIRIVGDRFVFQSEILFASGSATIEDAGRDQLAQLASTLKQIAAEIPSEIDWVLRVDGHTDRQPINTPAFPSNWELSTARAVSVVKFLVEQGIPPQRLAATGFGEFQPLDAGGDEIAYRRNRRIEFKLTER